MVLAGYVTVIVEDKAGNMVEEELEFEVTPSFNDVYLEWVDGSGVDKEISLAAFEAFPDVVSDLYKKDELVLLSFLELAEINGTHQMDKNVAGIIAEKVIQDDGIRGEKWKVISDVCSSLNRIGSTSLKKMQVSYVCNATDYHGRDLVFAYGRSDLANILEIIGSHPDINVGFRQELSARASFKF